MVQVGAARGSRSGKSGQSNFFVGFHKHTIYGLIRFQAGFVPVALCSRVQPANISERRTAKSLFNFVRRSLPFWPMRIAVGDKGYLRGWLAAWYRINWQLVYLVRPKADMKPPRGCDSDGCPLCPAGERLRWEDYDPQDQVLLWRGQPAICKCCPLRAQCPGQFEADASVHETFWGMLPTHTELARRLLRQLRPRVEPGFNIAKNCHRLKDIFLNSRQLAQMVCTMSDVLETINVVIKLSPHDKREVRKYLKDDIHQPELRD